MTAPRADEIVAGYLARLAAALAPVPEARRLELLDELREHIAEARQALSVETDADVLNILDRLGDPADVAGAAVWPRQIELSDLSRGRDAADLARVEF